MARKASLALIEESQTRWAETAGVELHGVGHVATLRDNLFWQTFKMRAFMSSSASSGR